MADKRKGGKEPQRRRAGGATGVVRRRRGGEAGRIAVRRDTAAYRRTAIEEHTAQVNERIEAALAEGRRIRQDIEERIDERLKAERGKAAQVVTEVTARSRLRSVAPLPLEASREGEVEAPRRRK
jgi:hypothetical protein